MQPHQRARLYRKWISALANAARHGLPYRRHRYWSHQVTKLSAKLLKP